MRPDDFRAALICSAALADLAGGVLFDVEEEAVIPGNQAISWATRILS